MKKAPFILVLLVVVPALLWGQFYDQLPQEKRHELAEAYWLVGKQYIETGKEPKGRAFQQMAFLIDPQLDPSQIKPEDVATAEELIARRAPIVMVEPVEELLRSRFMRLVGSFLASDTASVLELLDGSIAVDGVEVTQPQVREELGRFFADRSLRGLAPSEVYDLGSLGFTRNPPGSSPRWDETYRLSVRARRDFSATIGFWRQRQDFYIHRRGGEWLFMAIGSMPPARWVPREAGPADRAAEAALLPGGSGEPQQVYAAFLECMEYFLQEDIRSAREYLYPQVKILRLNESISREEMIAAFQSYFNSKDFTGVSVRDLIDDGSIFVEPTDRFREEVGAPVYQLSVKTRLDLSDRIPFWTRFQEYFFTRQDDSWKIFAIF